MKRAILFNAKLKDKEQADFFGDWIFGDLIQLADGAILIRQQETGQDFEVIPETVGQFTGLYDKNGAMIYEGGIITMTGGFILESYPTKGEVIYNHSSFVMRGKNVNNVFMNMSLSTSDGTELQVIGNIHDNPELLCF